MLATPALMATGVTHQMAAAKQVERVQLKIHHHHHTPELTRLCSASDMSVYAIVLAGMIVAITIINADWWPNG